MSRTGLLVCTPGHAIMNSQPTCGGGQSMLLRHALRGVFGRSSTTRRRGARRTEPRSARRRLAVEALEDRVLLSYTFTLIEDTSPDSLFSAIPFVSSINN